MYFEFLFRRAHSRSRVERMYWSGVSLNSFTTCSKEVTVGTTGPIGSGLPQFGFPRRFAISYVLCFLLFEPNSQVSPATSVKDLPAHTAKIHSRAFMGKMQVVPPEFSYFAACWAGASSSRTTS